MRGYVHNIERQTDANRDFRRVLYTGPHLQLVLMALLPGEEIGTEVHQTTDQFFHVESGTGEVSIAGRTTRIERGTAIIVPAGARHNVRNTGRTPLKLYTLFAPPEHEYGTVHHARADAEEALAQYSAVTTE